MVVYPGSVSISVGVLWILTVVQIVIGANVRADIEALIVTNPLATDHELLALVGGIKYGHLFLGVVVAAMAFAVGVQVYRTTPQPDSAGQNQRVETDPTRSGADVARDWPDCRSASAASPVVSRLGSLTLYRHAPCAVHCG